MNLRKKSFYPYISIGQDGKYLSHFGTKSILCLFDDRHMGFASFDFAQDDADFTQDDEGFLII